MKNFGRNINIDKNTNVVIGHTEVDFSSARINSLINIDKDGHFYTIGAIEPFNFISDFTIKNNDLIIPGNVESYFLFEDILTISYKEYELLTILNINNKGTGYKVGDILSLSGGILSVNIIDNTSFPTLLKVEEISSNGEINKLTIAHRGAYISFPEKNNKLQGGSGKDANILLESNLNSNRKMIERQVVSAESFGPDTVIELNYKLPKDVYEGKISMSKYKIILTSNYVGETKRNINYSIARDYTPIYYLPLALKNGNKFEESYNYTVIKMEQKIKELEDKINSLLPKT